MPPKSKVTVAKYLEQQIALSDKSQKQIAEECGYDKPNILTMFKQGKSKLPINKVKVMAVALGIDPMNLLRIAMSEYMPETWETIESIAGPAVSKSELAALKVIRAVTDGAEIDFTSPEVKTALAEALKPIADRESKLRATRAAAYSKEHARS